LGGVQVSEVAVEEVLSPSPLLAVVGAVVGAVLLLPVL